MIHALGLLVCNIGNNPTFKSGSIIEVTLSSPGVVDRVSDWCVLDVESLSDHFYIQYNIHTDEALFSNIAPLKCKWKFNYKKLDEALSLEQLCVAPNIMGVEDDAWFLTLKIHEASMTKSVVGSGRKSVYGWSSEITNWRVQQMY